MSARTRVIAVAVAISVCVGAMARGSVAPQGLYFHSFTGSVSGSEWATWAPRPGANAYEFSDLSSGGTYQATVTPEGAITFAAGRGSGTFHDENRATMDFTLGGGLVFHSEIVRAPLTDERFPVLFTGAVAGDDSRTGEWHAVIRSVDRITGETLEERSEPVSVASVDSTVRLTLLDGTFFQGVWVAGDQASFRVIEPSARLTRYRTIPGSETSVDLDMVGEVRITGANSMSAVLAFQTRTPLGAQIQTLTHISLSRVPAPGAAIPLATLVLASRPRRRAHDRREFA